MMNNEIKIALKHLDSIDNSLKRLAKCAEEANNAAPYIQEYRKRRIEKENEHS